MVTIDQVLSILEENGIYPDDISNDPEFPVRDIPSIGEIGDNEIYFPLSVKDLFDDDYSLQESLSDNRTILEWADEIERITDSTDSQIAARVARKLIGKKSPSQICAWYCPIHYFGKRWGIYIRQSCVLDMAKDLAAYVDTKSLSLSKAELCLQLYKASFFTFYFHEHFHHKVESFGFRLLISSGSDKYRKYKKNVYKSTYGTSACLEESMANADIYRRLSEPKYSDVLELEILNGLRKYLKEEMFIMQPPGYSEAVHYLGKKENREGLFNLQSQVLEGVIQPKMSSNNWLVANNMIRSLKNMDAKIYTIVPSGTMPLFSRHISPLETTSTKKLVKSLIKYFGYKESSKRGKGSHIMLIKDGFQSITIPGNRETVSPKIALKALQAIGEYPLHRLNDLLAGNLKVR